MYGAPDNFVVEDSAEESPPLTAKLPQIDSLPVPSLFIMKMLTVRAFLPLPYLFNIWRGLRGWSASFAVFQGGIGGW